MAEIWAALGALTAIVLPPALAAWLLTRSDGRGARGKMPRRHRHKPDAD